MFNIIKQSFRDSLIANELQEFSKKYLVTDTITSEDFKDCHVLFRTPPNRTSYQNLLTRSKVITSRKLPVPKAHSYLPLFDDVSQDIATLDTQMELPDSIEAIYKIASALGTKFYGALLVDDTNKIKINPLHPLTALSFCADDKNPNTPISWKVVIFLYKDRAALDKLYSTNNADLSIIEENLTDLINCHLGRVDLVTKNIECALNTQSQQIDLSYKVEHHPDDDQNSEGLLVAHQLLTRGIVVPYYGTSILKMEPGKTKGVNVSPMISSNISHNSNYNGGRFYDSKESKEKNLTVDISYTPVCTGSSDNTTLKGLRTLTHSNTLSPYNRNIITDGSLAYVIACNKKSFDIYRLAQILKSKETDYGIQVQSEIKEKPIPTETADESDDSTEETPEDDIITEAEPAPTEDITEALVETETTTTTEIFARGLEDTDDQDQDQINL